MVCYEYKIIHYCSFLIILRIQIYIYIFFQNVLRNTYTRCNFVFRKFALIVFVSDKISLENSQFVLRDKRISSVTVFY